MISPIVCYTIEQHSEFRVNSMSIAEILPIIETLPHTEKLQLMQFLLTQLANEEGVSLQEQSHTRDFGKQMASILQRMADRGALSSISDPITWQQEVRQDRPLPGRE